MNWIDVHGLYVQAPPQSPTPPQLPSGPGSPPRTEEESDTGTRSSSSGSSDERLGIVMARDALWVIASGDFKKKRDCMKVLEEFARTAGVDVNKLVDQITDAAKAATATIYDGLSSSTPYDESRFPGTVAPGSQITVGQWFAADSGREAISQSTGTAIWIRTENWLLSAYRNSNGTFTSYAIGTMMHELFHKQMVSGGFNHTEMNQAIKASGLGYYVIGRNDISSTLGERCFK